jgi:glycosyltransferase involved in cell wall biosynthesis
LTTNRNKSDDCEILVIDNNSTDDTANIISKLSKQFDHITYISEQKQGLSQARNAAINYAKSPWILFLDDDGLSAPDMIKQALKHINHSSYICIGGVYEPLYLEPKPKWIHSSFESFSVPWDKIQEVNDCGILPHGGILLLKTDIVKRIGGFNTKMGRIGNSQGYAEETELFHRLKLANYKIAIDPELKMSHLVNKNKYKLGWHLRDIYFREKALTQIGQESFREMICAALKASGRIWVRSIPQFFTKKHYYWQNLLIDTSIPIQLILGYISGIIKGTNR